MSDGLNEVLKEALGYIFCDIHVVCPECMHGFKVFGAGVSAPTLADLKSKAHRAMFPESFGGKSERAELQVSLLNEIGLTLTAMVKHMKEIGEEQRAQRHVIEEAYALEAQFKELGENFMLRLTDFEHNIAEARKADEQRLTTRLAQIEERLDKLKYERSTALENNMATLNKLVLSERSDRVIGKPRKAGKRPAHKAKVTHKTR